MEDGSKSINDREPKLGTKEHAEWVSKYLKPTNNKRISKPVEQVFKGSASGKQIQSADSSQSSEKNLKSSKYFHVFSFYFNFYLLSQEIM